MEHSEALVDVGEVSFNIHRFAEKVGRKNCMSVLTMHVLQSLGLD